MASWGKLLVFLVSDLVHRRMPRRRSWPGRHTWQRLLFFKWAAGRETDSRSQRQGGKEIFLRNTCTGLGKGTVKNTEIQIYKQREPPDCLLCRGIKSIAQSCFWEHASSACAAILQKGDTPLHVAIRGRSRRLAELLLRNPKDGRLLYRPNKAGETPYNIDCSHQKSILTQIFGASK